MYRVVPQIKRGNYRPGVSFREIQVNDCSRLHEQVTYSTYEITTTL